MKPITKTLMNKDGIVHVGDWIPFKDTVNGQEFMAELIAVLENDNREFAIFSIPNPYDTCDIIGTYITKDKDGNDTFTDITDTKDLMLIEKYLLDLLYAKDPTGIFLEREKIIQELDSLIALLDRADEQA